MSDSTPQPTPVLIKRLHRVARYFDGQALALETRGAPEADVATARARANVCWQSAGRLADLMPEKPVAVEEERRAPERWGTDEVYDHYNKHSKAAMRERLGVTGDVDE